MAATQEGRESSKMNELKSPTGQTRKCISSIKETLNLQCEWGSCNYISGNMDPYLAHVDEHCCQQIESACLSCYWRDCGFTANNIEELMRHIYFHAYHTKIRCIGNNLLQRVDNHGCGLDSLGRNLIPELPEDFRCRWIDCQNVFSNAELYYRHVMRHAESCGSGGKNPKGGVTCGWESCGNQFQNQYKLRDHLRSHSQEKIIACPTCGALFANRTKLFDHVKRQTPIDLLEYQCSHCSKQFSSERLLRDHMRTHVNHYKCCYCDMTCPTPSSLHNHIKYRHSEAKPFSCVYCDYTCKTQSDLKRHISTHGSDPQYPCSHTGCNYATRSYQSLTNHVRKVHSGDPTPRYMCHICEKLFGRGNYLTNHLIKKHKFRWPSGHSRFRYKCDEDGFYRLQTVRYESIELTQNIMMANEDNNNEEVVSETMTSSTASAEGTVFELPVMLQENGGDILVTFEQDENGSQVVLVATDANSS